MDAPAQPETPARPLPLRSLPLVQREIALLVVLSGLAAALFGLTRQLAQWSRARDARTALAAYTRGEALLRQDQTSAGLSALRDAVANDRDTLPYSLALARALAAHGRPDEARGLLERLRDLAPDDIEINYRLARLAPDEETALRYYTYALYGVPRTGPGIGRREIREELITSLLDHGTRDEAILQLDALALELPDDAAAELEAASLATRAGDTPFAFDRFAGAARLDPDNREAALGAGEAAFTLHDYPSAARDLRRARELGPLADTVVRDLDVAELVVADDPLASHLPAAGRKTRLLAGITWAAGRYDTCTRTAGAVADDAASARAGLDPLRRAPAAAVAETDSMARALALISRTVAGTLARCPQSATPTDTAWQRIADLHEGSR